MPFFNLSPGLMAYLLFLTVVLGAAMGSFGTCMAWRIARGEDFLRGRSHCDTCGHVLGAKDLIPVVSWLILRGQCRCCGGKISPRCLFIELLSAAGFVGIVLGFGITLQTAQYLILTVLLLVIALVDYDTSIIPDRLLLAIFIDWLVLLPLLNEGHVLYSASQGILGGLTASVPLFLLSLLMDHVLKRESMGGGDIKLFFVTGLFFSWQQVFFLLILSCVLGLIFAIITGKSTGDEENPKAFPFGPAIVVAVYLSLLIAEPVIRVYLRLF